MQFDVVRFIFERGLFSREVKSYARTVLSTYEHLHQNIQRMKICFLYLQISTVTNGNAPGYLSADCRCRLQRNCLEVISFSRLLVPGLNAQYRKAGINIKLNLL